MQGERRFFRVCMKHLAKNHPDAVRRNLAFVPEIGRWDDLFELLDTPVRGDVIAFVKEQLAADVQTDTPSLMAKWMPSCNCSSVDTRQKASILRKALSMTEKQYRKTLAILRERIKVLERLMSEGRWDEIEFNHVPSVAGFRYRKAFERNGMTCERYKEFAESDETKVNAGALYLYEIVYRAMEKMKKMNDTYSYWHAPSSVALDDTERLMLNKYWENACGELFDEPFNGIVMADTSGSMTCNLGKSEASPLSVALSLAMYCAERNKGPFANCFMTFSTTPKFVEFEGVDFCDKVYRATNAEWSGITNVEAAFDLLLSTAVKNHLTQDEIPSTLVVVSDMQFNASVTSRSGHLSEDNDTLFESMKQKWSAHGYEMPHLVFWNVNAFNDANFQLRPDDNVSYISGFSHTVFQKLIKGLDAFDLMFEVLDSERYADIH